MTKGAHISRRPSEVLFQNFSALTLCTLLASLVIKFANVNKPGVAN